MDKHLIARHELITNMAVLAREMFENVNCGDWKWNEYKNRLNKLANANSGPEEKNAKLNKRLEALCEIFQVFLALMCICGAIVLWISVLGGVFQFLSGDIALKEFTLRILGACAFTSPIVYCAIKGESENEKDH